MMIPFRSLQVVSALASVSVIHFGWAKLVSDFPAPNPVGVLFARARVLKVVLCTVLFMIPSLNKLISDIIRHRDIIFYS